MARVAECHVIVAAARQEVVRRDAIDPVILDWSVVDLERHNALATRAAGVGHNGESRDLRKAAAGSGPACKSVLESALETRAADRNGHGAVAKRHLRDDIPARDAAAGGVDPASPDAAAIRHRRVCPARNAHGIGNEISDCGLPAAHRCNAAVELDRRNADGGIDLPAQILLIFRNNRGDLRVGRNGSGINDPELRPPDGGAGPASLAHFHGYVDRSHVLGVVARLDDGIASVKLNEKVVVVSAEQKINGAGRKDRVVLLARRMHHSDDEVCTLAPQRLRLLADRCYGGKKLQILGIGRARSIVIGGSGQTDTDPVKRDDRAILELRQRLPLRTAQIGCKERKLCLAHPLQEDGLAEIEFVIARYKDIGSDHVA